MSYFPAGQIAILAYAGRIFSVALAFGVSVGVVALAQWSGGDTADGDREQGAATSRSAATAVLFTLVPGTVALIVMSDVLVRALFGDSAMDRDQLSVMTIALSIYSLSLVPTALLGVIMRGFYAVEDPKGALSATAIWVTVWVALDVVCIPRFGLYGLAAASVISVWFTLIVVLARWKREPWLRVWPAVLLSRETMVITISSVIAMTVAAEVIRHMGIPLGLASAPLAVAAYLAMSAAGGSSLARDVLHFLYYRRGPG